MAHRILFVDRDDSCRGPMAAALARQYGLDADSAGTMPGRAAMEGARISMRQRGLDISRHIPRAVDLAHTNEYERIICLCTSVHDTSPDLHVHDDWHVPDVHEGTYADFCTLRDRLEQDVEALAAEYKGFV